MFRWLRSLWSGAKKWRVVRARYDAAQTTDSNRKHWSLADGLSARLANSPSVRQVLRNRARYEVANNCYASGIIQTLQNDLIGTGPRLQLLTDNQQANRKIELAFSQWAADVALAEKLRTMRFSRGQDGEAFALLATNPRLLGPVKLDLQLIEAEQISTPNLSVLEPNAVDGIEFDPYKNPAYYHLLRQHPGDGLGNSALDYDRVPAEWMIHWFRCDRPGQVRGVPDLTAALPLYPILRRYTMASLLAAETAANLAGVMQTDSSAGDDADDIGDEKVLMEIEANYIASLPFGWKLNQFKAEQPTTNYPQFKQEILNEIARCMNVPYNVAACNSASYNYASGRLDYQIYFRSLKVDRSHLEHRVLNRVLRAWLDEAVLIPGLLPTGVGLIADWRHQWFWDGTEHVDPQKEANAQKTRLSSGTTSRGREYAREGLDVEEEDQKSAREWGVTLEEYRALLRQSTFGSAKAITEAVPAGDDLDDDLEEEESDA